MPQYVPHIREDARIHIAVYCPLRIPECLLAAIGDYDVMYGLPLCYTIRKDSIQPHDLFLIHRIPASGFRPPVSASLIRPIGIVSIHVLRIAAGPLLASIAHVWSSLQPQAFIGCELRALCTTDLIASPAASLEAHAAACTMHGTFFILPSSWRIFSCRNMSRPLLPCSF